jgi:hypothetical protein
MYMKVENWFGLVNFTVTDLAEIFYVHGLAGPLVEKYHLLPPLASILING